MTEKTKINDEELMSKALKGICLTRDYVGEGLLPAIDGWEWYESGKALAERIPDDEWAEQFWLRVNRYKREKNESIK